MGYLKRPVRRSSSRRDARRFAAATPGATATPDPPAVGYVRLAIDGAEGIFSAAYDLRRANVLSAFDRSELNDALDWFAKELPAHAPAEPAAVFWFRADAATHVRQVWRLVRLLQQHGHDVRMWTTHRPGRVVFADPFQVAAVSFRSDRPAVKYLPRP